MGILRVKKVRRDPYVVLDLTAANDERLSFRAIGIHTYLMSKPDDWHVHITELAECRKKHLGLKTDREGKSAIAGTLKELEQAGYIHRARKRVEGGRIEGWETVVYETPQLCKDTPPPEPPDDGEDEAPEVESPKADFPTSVKPTSVIPTLEKGALLIIDSTQVLNLARKDSDSSESEHARTPEMPDMKMLKPVTLSKPPKPTPAKPSRRAPQDFVITPALRAWAAGCVPGVDIDFATGAFLDHEYRVAHMDWDAAWRNWMRGEAKDTRTFARVPAAAVSPSSYLQSMRHGLLTDKERYNLAASEEALKLIGYQRKEA